MVPLRLSPAEKTIRKKADRHRHTRCRDKIQSAERADYSTQKRAENDRAETAQECHGCYYGGDNKAGNRFVAHGTIIPFWT